MAKQRSALCDLVDGLGRTPTVCGDWTTRDFVAHLVNRERRSDTAVGILLRSRQVSNLRTSGGKDWVRLS